MSTALVLFEDNILATPWNETILRPGQTEGHVLGVRARNPPNIEKSTDVFARIEPAPHANNPTEALSLSLPMSVISKEYLGVWNQKFAEIDPEFHSTPVKERMEWMAMNPAGNRHGVMRISIHEYRH